MTWILILFFFTSDTHSSNGKAWAYSTSSMEHIKGFATPEQCADAGSQVKKINLRINFVCVKAGAL